MRAALERLAAAQDPRALLVAPDVDAWLAHEGETRRSVERGRIADAQAPGPVATVATVVVAELVALAALVACAATLGTPPAWGFGWVLAAGLAPPAVGVAAFAAIATRPAARRSTRLSALRATLAAMDATLVAISEGCLRVYASEGDGTRVRTFDPADAGVVAADWCRPVDDAHMTLWATGREGSARVEWLPTGTGAYDATKRFGGRVEEARRLPLEEA